MSSNPSDPTLVQARTHDRDPSRAPAVKALRETRARLSGPSLRRLRETLFKLELTLVEDMIAGGVSIPKVAAISDCARALEVVEVLQVGARER